MGGKAMNNYRRAALAALAAAAALTTVGCAAVAVGAVAGGVMIASDRRSSGIQLEDQAIELRVREALGKAIPSDRANISVTSYNLRVLLTGEVTEAQLKAEAEAIARKSDNVRGVLNELYVGSLSTAANRNFDTALTSKVLAAMLQDKNVPSSAIKVVSERAVVYLMGRVTPAEGEAAARVASRVSGVQRVVKNFDYLTEAEAAAEAAKAAPAKQ
ncbi:MAG: BON domain-containing protein [Burkholderiales bacterium]|jgi:osmotically-inducible protein OsmY|nr:BON domain-containing protein [Burkholderiales bacterium]